MDIKKYGLLILAILFVFPTFAGVIRGVIIDKDKFPVSYASVALKGTQVSTTTNAEGAYIIKVPAGSYTVSVNAMAYAPSKKTVKLNEQDTIEVNFVLNPESLELKTTTVTTKFQDRGITIMRQVIENRKKYADMMQTFETDIYMKGILKLREMPDQILGIKISEDDKKEMNNEMGLEEGKGIMYALEQMTHYLYKAPNKTYNNVISIRESGNPNGLGFAQMPPIINIYENNIVILEGLNKRGFISPASNNAFLYYNFKYLGTFEDGDYQVHKISVIPKRKFEPLFTGNVYVVDSLWLFQSIELTLTRASQMDLLDTLTLEQYFRPVKDSLWMIQNQTLYPTAKILGVDLAGNFVTSYMNQRINEPIADERFPKKIISTYDSLSQSKSLAYWDTIRPVALEKDEEQSFKHQDSMHIVYLEKRDSIKAMPNWRFGFTPVVRFYKKSNNVTLSNPLFNTGYNTVEGLYTGANLNYTRYLSSNNNNQNRFSINTFMRYGFSNKHFNPLMTLRYKMSKKGWNGDIPHSFWELKVGSEVKQLNPSDPVNGLINTAYTLLFAENYSKLFENRKIELGYTNKTSTGWSFSAIGGYYQRRALVNTTDFTFTKANAYKLTSNHPDNLDPFVQEDAAIVGLNISFQPGWKYIQYPKFKSIVRNGNAPIMYLDYRKGIPGIANSVSDFDKWEIGFGHELRLKMLGVMNYAIKGGGFLNDNHVAIPDRKHLNGNRTILAGPYLNTFQLASYYNYANTAPIYGQLHAEWLMSGFLSNKIPLFKRLNWHFLAGTNSFFVNQNSYYAEVFVGMNNIGFNMYRLFRVDAVFGYESGIAKPTFGIRLGLNLKGSMDTNDEGGGSISIGL